MRWGVQDAGPRNRCLARRETYTNRPRRCSGVGPGKLAIAAQSSHRAGTSCSGPPIDQAGGWLLSNWGRGRDGPGIVHSVETRMEEVNVANRAQACQSFTLHGLSSPPHMRNRSVAERTFTGRDANWMFALQTFSHARDQTKSDGFLEGLSTLGELGRNREWTRMNTNGSGEWINRWLPPHVHRRNQVRHTIRAVINIAPMM